MQLSFLLPENVVRHSLEYEHWRKQWKCFALVDFGASKSWYLGVGKLPQEAIDQCNTNMLMGVSVDTFEVKTPSQITKGERIIDRIKREKQENEKPLEEMF